MATVNIIVTDTPMSSIAVHDGDLVVIRFNDQIGPEMLQQMCQQAVDAIRGLGTKVSVMALGSHFQQTTIEVFSAVEMKQMGWVRAGEPVDG